MKSKSPILILTLVIFIVNYSLSLPDPVGEVLIGGNTWAEMQWGHSNVDDMIILDTLDNTIHIVWTYAPPPPFEGNRRSYYNNYNPLNGWFAQEPGYNMFPGFNAQINHTIMLTDNVGGRDDLEIGLARDRGFLKNRVWWEESQFVWEQIDSIFPPIELNVRTAFGNNGFVHMVCWDEDISLKYGKYSIDPYEFMGWNLVDTLTYLTFCIAASPVTDRVALSYLRQKSFEQYPCNSIDQDVYFLDSPDGIEWNWDDKTDITHFAYSDIFRPYFDNDIIIDHDDKIHIAFSTFEAHINPEFPESTTVDWQKSLIWHWSEEADSFSVAAYGWETEIIPLGVWKLPVDRPQLATDPNSGYIYILYERNRPDDISGGCYPNTDLWISVSTDNGLNWSVGTNITDTQTPDCLPGYCNSEIQASINEIVNDTLHIVYILDKDPGMYAMDEGALVENKVVYQKIPAELIQAEPLLTQFSIRDTLVTEIDDPNQASLPFRAYLFQNYPNPFNATTRIRYILSSKSEISIDIYDLMGRKVVTLFDGIKEAGEYSLAWDAADLSSGIYFVRLKSGQESYTKKAVLIR
jgi:hypothetical protein